jgi:translocation and assembly module TamB
MSDFVSSSSESNSREDEYSVEIGKYVTKGLMLKFSQGIGSAHKQRYGVEYDVNDHFSLVVEREGHDTVVGFTSRFQF